MQGLLHVLSYFAFSMALDPLPKLTVFVYKLNAKGKQGGTDFFNHAF